MTLRPCLDCGVPTDTGTRCPVCRPPDHQLSAHQRGYDAAWRRLSKQARRLQPFCTDCGATDDLTVDHSREAWERRAQGLAIRLEDVTTVCRSCNARRGRARPTPGDPPSTAPGPLGKPQSPLLTTGPLAGTLPPESDLADDLDRANVGLHLIGEHHQFRGEDHVAHRGDDIIIGEAVAEQRPESTLAHFARLDVASQVGSQQAEAPLDALVQDGFFTHEGTLS